MNPTRGPVAVTGGTGFVGANLVRRLLERGVEVHLLQRPGAKYWRLEDVRDRVEIHEAEVSDAERVKAALGQIKPRAIVHLATEGAYEDQADPHRILRTNVSGTLNLLEAACACGKPLFVNVGSSSEYGFKDEPMCETDVLEPNSYYSAFKSAQTHLTSVVSQLHELPAVTIRLFSIYGPWEEPSRLIPTLIRRARSGETLKMVAPEIARDFVFVDDVTELLCDFEGMAALRGEVFNAGSGVQTTLGQVVDAVQKTVGDSSEVHWGAFERRHWDSKSWLGDSRKTAERLGWQASTTLLDGISRTAAWSQSREKQA